MNLHKEVKLWADREKGMVNCIIEIPMWSMVKYEWNKEYNTVEVDRFYTAPMPAPLNYWTLPQTHNVWDWDPLDIFLISNYPIVPGAVSKAKVIWVLHMVDGWESDDKIIAIPNKEPNFWHINDVSELPTHIKDQLNYFLSYYKRLEKKETEVTGWEGREAAIKIVEQCEKDYQK